MKSVIYFRSSFVEEEESTAAKQSFRVVTNRTSVKPGELVIPRYSALPFNKELCEDIVALGATPINTYREHCYVADVRNWYYDIGDITPRTWFSLDQIPDEGPFVLKGATNSKKMLWNTHMFAKNKREAIDVFGRLSQDSTIGLQPIYVRQFIPLNCLTIGLNNMPVNEEYRFFVLDGKIVGSGFYWTSHMDDLDRTYDPEIEVPPSFIQDVINRCQHHVRFWVFDVARRADGGWIVIELNDGQQSGLSEISAEKLYSNMATWLDR